MSRNCSFQPTPIVAALLPLLTLLGVVSCGGENKPPEQNRQATLEGAVVRSTAKTDPGEQTQTTTAAPGRDEVGGAGARPARDEGGRLPEVVRPDSAAGVRRSEAPDPPEDARYTIYCTDVDGPAHVEEARRMKEALIRQTKMREWYLVHGEGESTLYYGFYRSINDPEDAAESERAQADRKKIDAMTFGAMEERPFSNCIFVELASPDPDEVPEWNLAKVNQGKSEWDQDYKVWSLQVGAYTGSADRKRAAVEAVRAAREMGEEAYYYHGPTASSVCIGAWPAEAVDADVDATSPDRKRDPTRSILVLPPEIQATGSEVVDEQGRPMEAMTNRMRVVDPTLLQKMRDYPVHGLNGEFVRYKTKDGRVQDQPSFLVRIRSGDEAMQSDAYAGDVPTTGGGGAYSPRDSDPWNMTSASETPAHRQPERSAGEGRRSKGGRGKGTGGLRSLEEEE